MRVLRRLLVAAAIARLAADAQMAEPILTKAAIPFALGSGALKLDYAGGIGQSGGTSQVIPEGTLEAGVAPVLEVLIRFPLLRVRAIPEGPAVIGGGQLAIGARYLLAGSAERSYAISVQAIVETPTGDTQLVGNATQLMPGVLADWHPTTGIVVHSNITFDRSISGRPKAAFLQYADALVWAGSKRVLPVFEFAGSTNAITGRTQLIGQPELIAAIGQHLELKGGLQLGLNSKTSRLGLRTQAAWFWGKRK